MKADSEVPSTEANAFDTANIVFSSPAVADGVVYVGSRDANLYALNAVGPDPGPAVLVNGTTVRIENAGPGGDFSSATSPTPGQVTVSGFALFHHEE